jgi:hypothetical protein
MRRRCRCDWGTEALTRITGLDAAKIDDKVVLSDVPPLLALGASLDPEVALGRVRDAFLSRLPESASKQRKERKRP